MAKRTWLLVSCAAIVASLPWVWRLLAKPAEGNSSPAPLAVDAASLDLGDVWAQDEYEWKLRVQNTSAAPVQVGQVSVSCSCTRATPREFTVPANGAVDLDLKLDLNKAFALSEDSGNPRGMRIGLAPIATDQLPLPMAAPWILTGRIHALPIEAPVLVDLGDCVVEAAVPASEVALRFDLGVASDAQCAQPPENLSLELASGAEPGTKIIRVAPRETALRTIGEQTAEVLLTSVLRDGKTCPPKKVGVRWTVVEPVGVSPEFQHAGVVPVGELARANITLFSRQKAGYTVKRVSCDDPAVRIVPLAEQGGGTRGYALERRVERRGQGRARITLECASAAGREFTLISELAYDGS